MKQEESINPLISVIVPVYNVSPYLREALDSLIYQTWKNLEILLVDDGSTDGSGEICDEYTRDPRVRVFHQENRGLSGARNTGLDHMAGDYVAFLDPDDAFHPKMIEQLYLVLSENHADLAACSFDCFRTEGSISDGEKRKSFVFPVEKVLLRQETFLLMGKGLFSVVAWNKLYRRSLWDDLRYPEGWTFEDVWTMPKVLDRCVRVVIIPKVLVYHRNRNNSISDTYTAQNCLEQIVAYKAAQKYLEQMKPILPSDILQANWEYSMRTVIFRWGKFRDRRAARYDVEFIRAEILAFAGDRPRFTNLKTKVVWRIFLHCPGMLVLIQAFFGIYLKITGFFRHSSPYR